jgi:RHS repeat-associated core domain
MKYFLVLFFIFSLFIPTSFAIALDPTSTTYLPDQFFTKEGATTTVAFFAGNELVAIREGNGIATSTRYVHSDHLGSTHIVSDRFGTVAELTDYYPYGSQRLHEIGNITPERRKYTGHDYDEDTNLTYAKARYYNQDIARWLSQDTASRDNPEQFLEDPQQLNSYAYARNNPLIFVDPDGKKVELAAKSLFGGLGNHIFYRVTPNHPSEIRIGNVPAGATEFTLGAYNPD